MTQRKVTENEKQPEAGLGFDRPIRVEIIAPKKSLLGRVAEQVPIFISLLALALSIWSATESRRHDKLSLMPRVHFIREGDMLAKAVGLFIDNFGLGPADIREMRIYLDGKRISNIAEISNSTFTKLPLSWASSKSYAVKSGERLPLIYTATENVKSIGEFMDFINRRLFVIAKACSLNHDCGVFCSPDPQGNEGCIAEEKRYATIK